MGLLGAGEASLAGSFCCRALSFEDSGGKQPRSKLGWASMFDASAEDRTAGSGTPKSNSSRPARNAGGRCIIEDKNQRSRRDAGATNFIGRMPTGR